MKAKHDVIPELWGAICKKNDERSFEQLFHLLYTRLIHFCVLYVHRKETAEEIVADVFVKCWLQRHSLAHVTKPEVYLFVAVKNGALNYLKSYSHYHLTQTDELGTAAHLVNTSHPDRELEKKELLLRMDQAIATLPRQCRIIFRLIKEDGLKYKEVAEILHISARTVQTQLFRAMKKLGQAMQSYLPDKTPDHHTTLLPILSLLLHKIFFSGL